MQGVEVVGNGCIKKLRDNELIWLMGTARGYRLFAKIRKYRVKQGYRVDVIRKTTRTGYRILSTKVCNTADEVIDFLGTWGMYEEQKQVLKQAILQLV